MSNVKLVQGDVACAIGAIDAGCKFLPAIPLHLHPILPKRCQNVYLWWEANLSRWRMKLPAWLLLSEGVLREPNR